jgi:chromosome segregation ATPase
VITLLGRERERADRAEAELARCQEELQEATRARQAAEESEALTRALEGLGVDLQRQQHQVEVAELQQRIDDVVDAGRAAEVENDMLREHVKEVERELDYTEAELLAVEDARAAARRHYRTHPNGTVKLRAALAALRTEHEAAQAELTQLRARLAPPVAGFYDSDDELSDVD